MKKIEFGYGGNILRVDLTSETIHSEPINEAMIHNFIGGRGFSSSVLYNELGKDVNPLSSENLLVFAIGPLTGSKVLGSSRFIVASKAPVSGILGDGNAGGFWAPELKFAGYDLIVVRGKARRPAYLLIKDDRVEIKSAEHIWGKFTSETEIFIKGELDDSKTRVLSIGPAGENLVPYSCIIADTHHSASRCGMGAVMGSKNLKAIAVRGTKGIKVKNKAKLKEVVKELQALIRSDQDMRLFTDLGSAKYVDGANSFGAFPTRNYQTGRFKGSEKINGPVLAKYKVKNERCFSCTIQCDGFCHITEGKYKGNYIIPELVAIHSLGSGCGNDNIESIIYANDLCNNLGLDVASTGRSISCLLECNQRGILKESIKKGYDLSWGKSEEIIQLIKEIAYKQGLGELLALGSLKMARVIGNGADKYAMHSKGIELDAVDPRSSQGYGLGFATSSRGACHLRALAIERHWTEEAAEKVFGIKEIADRTATAGKGMFVKWHEDLSSIINALGICSRVFMETNIVYTIKKIDLIPQMLFQTTGIKMTKEALFRCGERITNIEKLFNLREGCTIESDSLPLRFLEEPLPEGPLKGQVHNLKLMIKEYYIARGWDPETSYPQKKKLKELNLL